MKKKINVGFKVKVDSPSKYEEVLNTFMSMLETWKYNKEGRTYEVVEDKENLVIEVNAKSKYGTN